MKNIRKLTSILVAVCMLLTTPFVYASEEYTSDTIKGVQEALNEAGYDCGTADGIAGSQTETAIKEYQTYYGLTVSGEIDDELLAALGIIAGMPVSAFVVRYNDATEYYNSLVEYGYENSDIDWEYAEYLTEDTVTDTGSFSPNNNLEITLNYDMDSESVATDDPNMITTVYAYSDDTSVVDSGLGLGELIAIIYAIDSSLAEPSEAQDLLSDLMSQSTEKESGFVTFIRHYGDDFYLFAQHETDENLDETDTTSSIPEFTSTFFKNLDVQCGEDCVYSDYVIQDDIVYRNVLYNYSTLATIAIDETSSYGTVMVIGLSDKYTSDYAADYITFLIYCMMSVDEDLSSAEALALIKVINDDDDRDDYTYNNIKYTFNSETTYLGITIYN